MAGRAYHYKEWCLARGRDCLYIWSDAAALELSNGFNGWLRYRDSCFVFYLYSSVLKVPIHNFAVISESSQPQMLINWVGKIKTKKIDSKVK